MKRTILLFLGILLLTGCGPKPQPSAAPPPAATPTAPPSNPPPVAETKEEETEPQKTSLMPAGKVADYSVTESFDEVTNYKAFITKIALTQEQKQLLQQNLFVCTPTSYHQLFHVYENNEYQDLPSFVTTDTVLQLYHIFYDYTLRSVESEALTPLLIQLTEGMLADSLKLQKETSDPNLQKAALKNVAFFGVAARALGRTPALPPEAARMAQAEQALIAKHEGFQKGAIFPYKIDYSQFVPRGHYTRTEKLKRFFTTMMWYGLVPFALKYGGPNGEQRADEQIRQGLLLTRSLYRTKLNDAWERIYEPTAFYVGTADDLTPAECQETSDETFGKDAPLTAYADNQKFDAFVEAAQKRQKARIKAEITLQTDMPDPAVQLRVMGQRYIPDSEILQRLSQPIERPFPSGMDVMAVLGSTQARTLIEENPKVFDTERWTEYGEERDKLIKEFAEVTEETWTSNLYWSWLHTLKALYEPVPEGYPSFMRNTAWQDKSVHTALGSWAELRHDTILYGKQSAVECGDGEDPPKVYGYVEPNVLFYDRLLALTHKSREGLTKRKLLSDKLKDRFENFEDLLTFLKTASEKELRNEDLTAEEYEQIRHIGGQIEYMTLSVAEGDILSETDKNMAVIADVHTGAPKVLEAGVGHAHEILVIVPVKGKLTLTRGAVFSYYEFTHPMNDRLTDEKWQAILKAGKAPKPPTWTRSFLTSPRPAGKKEDQLEVYGSGC